MSRVPAEALGRKLTEGPISSTLLRLAWPLMLSNLLQTLYNFTDRFWLARHSSVGIAALALSWPLVFLVLSLGGGVTIAGTALVAQYTGARRTPEANLAAGQVMAFVAVVSVVLAAAGFFAARPILALMGAEPALTAAAAIYLRILYAGIPAMFGTFVVTALLNGSGDTVTPLWLMAGSVLLNAGLDPVLIFGLGPFPKMGIAGAAVATVIARTVMSIVGFSLLFSGRLRVHVRVPDLRPRWGLIRRIVAIGGLASIGQSGTALGFAIMNGALARIGTAVLSAFGIGNAFTSIALMPVMGLGQATATMVGQNLGAEKPLRARRSAWAGMAWSTGILLVAAAVVLAFRASLMQVFLSDPEVVSVGTDMLLLVAFAFPFMGIIQVIMGTYQGSGHTGTSMFFDLFRLWALRVPLVYILEFAFHLGPFAVWWAMLASNLGTAAVALGFFLSGSWAHRVIRDADVPTLSTDT
ncbi:MAG: MATE family efflux transporter [Candidatus Bipolaricaulis sp.]|nr:MATE family efflux transporter [Candidatus Bipolaricaulis sp.]